MPSIYAAQALLPSGWTSNVRVEIAGSDIIGVFAGFAPGSGDTRVDYLLPSIANTHSHSFQRAMAGMTERRSEAKDTFWTWRKVMYRFLDLLTPDEIEIIASLTFIEMLEQGFSAVAEFHYVHHQPGGEPYAHLSETSQRILAAAQRTGIGLTMLPVLYSYGGLDKRPLMGGQIRFGNDVERFGKLFSEVETAMRMMPADSHIGYAPHSLRATDADQLKLLCDSVKGRPMHIHAAEQQLEVQDVQSGLGARPVRWLLDNMPVAENWCLIHSTQMDDGEVVDLAKSGAVAGLCPITESNLGDGIFAGQAFLSAHGAIGIGSDSNVKISLPVEISTLEYSQRLKQQQRNVLAQSGSTGEELYKRFLHGGARALQRNSGAITAGKLADLVAINSDDPALCALKPDEMIDGWVFASARPVVTDVWSAGRYCVANGVHHKRDEIVSAYRNCMQKLAARL